MKVVQLKTPRLAKKVTRMDKIVNEYIRRTAGMCRKDRVKESRPRWYHNVLRKDEDYAGRRATEMEFPGRKRRRQPKRRF